MPDTVSVVFSPESRRDLLDIKDYIANDFGSPRAASRAMERILDSSDVIKRFPEGGTSLAGRTSCLHVLGLA
jgi:plasmid stabilization system protein ParE